MSEPTTHAAVAQGESSPVDPPRPEVDDAGSIPVGLGAAASISSALINLTSSDELESEIYGVAFVAHQWEPDDQHTRVNLRSFVTCPHRRCVRLRAILAAVREGSER